MARIGITGHVLLAPGTAELISTCLDRELRPYAGPGLHGVTCLADGADQIFARVVLALGGTYEVIVPAADYRSRAVVPANRAVFDELLDRASSVTYMPYAHSTRTAYLAASEELLRRSDRLLAVWDGNPSADVGDTADVVRLARSSDIPITTIWPAGARRAPGPPA